jgi:hypothetical protein
MSVIPAILDDLPPYESDEPTVQRIYGALGAELDRLWAKLEQMRAGLEPRTATDDLEGLSLLETLLAIPVAPLGESEVSRRQKVLAYFRARRAGTGAAWIMLLQLALGDTPWRYREGPEDWTIHIFIPYHEGSFTAGRVLALARAITPAHIDIIAGYDEGFLVGISQIGIDSL